MSLIFRDGATVGPTAIRSADRPPLNLKVDMIRQVEVGIYGSTEQSEGGKLARPTCQAQPVSRKPHFPHGYQ